MRQTATISAQVYHTDSWSADSHDRISQQLPSSNPARCSKRKVNCKAHFTNTRRWCKNIRGVRILKLRFKLNTASPKPIWTENESMCMEYPPFPRWGRLKKCS